jgi:GLPGLI family protein
MSKLKPILLTSIVALIFLIGCKNISRHKKVDEGVIIYNINYLQDESENPIIGLLPSTMSMTFKNNSVLMEVEGWMSIFKSSFLRKGKNGDAISVLKIMNQKCYHITPVGQQFFGLKTDSIVIKVTDKKKEYLGYECNHARVIVSNDSLEYDVWYTKEISISNPNQSNPYEILDGVLMDFRLNMNGIPMHMTAKQFDQIEIENKKFNIPDGYEEVNAQAMQAIFDKVMKPKK